MGFRINNHRRDHRRRVLLWRIHWGQVAKARDRRKHPDAVAVTGGKEFLRDEKRGFA